MHFPWKAVANSNRVNHYFPCHSSSTKSPEYYLSIEIWTDSMLVQKNFGSLMEGSTNLILLRPRMPPRCLVLMQYDVKCHLQPRPMCYFCTVVSDNDASSFADLAQGYTKQALDVLLPHHLRASTSGALFPDLPLHFSPFHR